MPDLSRRKFLSFLSAAPVAVKLGILEAFDPHRVIFDMGRSLWKPEPKQVLPLDQINAISQKYLDEAITDAIFCPSPMFEYLSSVKRGVKPVKPFWGGWRTPEGRIVGVEEDAGD